MKEICMKLNIIGLGYIGLPTAAMFTSKGCEVIGVDTNPIVLEAIRSHQFHIEEHGLRELLIDGLESDLLRVQATPECADVFMIAVPTPITVQNTADLSYLRQAVKAINPYLRKGNTVIVESTIPPRTI